MVICYLERKPYNFLCPSFSLISNVTTNYCLLTVTLIILFGKKSGEALKLHKLFIISSPLYHTPSTLPTVGSLKEHTESSLRLGINMLM